MSETIESALELMREYRKEDIPTYVEGPPGVGKSSAAYQLSQELKIGFKDIRLAQMDPVDLRGLPTTQEVDQCIETIWARPDFWPVVERDGPKGIILFDEMSDTGRAMQSAAYQIILDRRAGPHVIPKGWYPMAAGNRRQDKAAAQAISTALATRFAWITVEADAETFVKWGNLNGIHPFVLGYLRARPTHIWTMEGANSNTFACPRQWAQVSKVCDRPPSIRHRLVRGLIGDGVAAEFEAVIKAFNLPDLKDILADPKKCRIPEQPAEKYALASMLAHNATVKNFGKIQQYVSRDAFGRDFWICMTLDATKRDANLCDTDAFTEFATSNSHLQL